MTSLPFFKMAAATAKYQFRFRICWCHCLQNLYQQTKFRRHTSIDGWAITTSVLEKKQTSAILESYFRFRFRPFARNLHIILHQATEFRSNRSTHSGNMTSYPFLKMTAATAKYYFRFRICLCYCLQKVKVYQQTKFRRYISNQILSTYLNCWLRYNYIRFWKTNVRHIGNLLSVSILTIGP